MLQNKLLIKTCISILIVIVVIIGSIYLYKYSILRNDNNQINALYSIFNEVCNEDEDINLNKYGRKNPIRLYYWNYKIEIIMVKR